MGSGDSELTECSSRKEAVMESRAGGVRSSFRLEAWMTAQRCEGQLAFLLCCSGGRLGLEV